MAAQQLILFRKARIDTIDPIPDREKLSHYETEASRTAITEEPNRAWTLVRPTIEEVVRVARRRSEHTPFSTPARVEGFRNDRLRQQGMAIFDTNGRLIIHVVHAVLNKGGASLNLSLNILQSLKIPSEMLFEILNTLQAERDYKFVISCEQHEPGVDGIEVIVTTHEINSEWIWWIIR